MPVDRQLAARGLSVPCQGLTDEFQFVISYQFLLILIETMKMKIELSKRHPEREETNNPRAKAQK